ncbi:MAG: hypothetical protein LBF79_02095, partial [Dysgonamonadaceae bacterium]|nr:hypothetical protein [Dysgonamonadaceae bacterium]
DHYSQAEPPKYPEGFINLTLVSNGDKGTGWECKNAPNYDSRSTPDVIVIYSPGEYKFVGSTSVNNIQVAENVKDVIIELRNAYIDVASQSKAAIDIRGGAEATIKLYGENYLGGGPNASGINVPHKGGSGKVPSTASVIITSASGDGSIEGYLKSTCGTFAAGIGASNQVHTTHGKITINGGTIESIGGGEFPGIGGRIVSGAIESSITVNGGKVTAVAGSGSAGIGSNKANINFGQINIAGGSVYASGNGNAAIGGGSGKISITGGTVVARNTVNSDGAPTKPGFGGATDIVVTNASIIATGIESKITVTNSTVLTSHLTGAFTDGGNAFIVKDADLSLAQQAIKTDATGESIINTNLLLKGNTTVPAENRLIIPEGEHLVINDNVTLVIEGAIVLRGGLTCNRGNIVGKEKIIIEGNGYFSDCGQTNTGKISSDAVESAVVGLSGGISVRLSVPAKIGVYTLSGQKVYSGVGLAGANTITLKKGLYIVRVGAKGYKVLAK